MNSFLSIVAAAMSSYQKISVTPLLDTLAVSPYAAQSLRLLKSSYTGPCIRIKNASNSQQTDIGFVDGFLDTATILSWLNGADGQVVTWYDQSGNGRDATLVTSVVAPVNVQLPPYISIGGSITKTANGKVALYFNDIPGHCGLAIPQSFADPNIDFSIFGTGVNSFAYWGGDMDPSSQSNTLWNGMTVTRPSFGDNGGISFTRNNQSPRYDNALGPPGRAGNTELMAFAIIYFKNVAVTAYYDGLNGTPTGVSTPFIANTGGRYAIGYNGVSSALFGFYSENIIFTTSVVSTESEKIFASHLKYCDIGPSLISVSPTHSSIPVLVTLTGKFMAGTTNVTFGGIPATSITNISGTTVTCVAPVVNGPSDIVLTAAGKTSTLSNAYTDYPPPQLDLIIPNQSDSSITVTIDGLYLTLVTGVTFGGVAATNIVVINDNAISCTAPIVSGPVDVVVTTARGTATLVKGYSNAPQITGLTTVTASGTNFGGVANGLYNNIGNALMGSVNAVPASGGTSPAYVLHGTPAGDVYIAYNLGNGAWHIYAPGFGAEFNYRVTATNTDPRGAYNIGASVS